MHHRSSMSARLLRYPECSKWMVEDCAEARRRYAGELIQAIRDSTYSVGTLEQTLRLLDHENLCLTLSSSNQKPISDPEATAALRRPFVEALLLKISQRLIHGVTVSSNLERELQTRIILSAISLLRAHGVEEVEASFFDEVQKQVQERYKDLKWQRHSAGTCSAEVFRRFQCSYLLCSCAAYAATRLVRSEPKAVVFLARVITAVSLAFDVASAATVISTFV